MTKLGSELTELKWQLIQAYSKMKYFSAKVAEVKTALKNNTFMMFLEICYLTAIKFSGVRPVVRVTRLFVLNQRKKTKNILYV